MHVSSDPAESLNKLGLFRSISLTFAVVLFSSVAAQADSIVFSNLGPLDSYVNNTFNVVRGAAADPPFGAADQANDFAVGPTAYTFTSAQLALGFCGGILFGCFGTNQIDILLMADAGGLPGAVLQSIIVNNLPDIGYPSSGALLTVHAVAPLTLQGGCPSSC